jgi:hypothetical protein
VTAEVQSLPAGEIDRSGSGVSTGAPGNEAPQGGHVEAQAAPMGEAQAAAVAHLAELRTQAADPSLDSGKRDALMKQLSELSRHAFLGEKSPSWYGEQKPDPKLSDTSDYDPMSSLNAPLSETMTADQVAQIRSGGTIRGLHPTTSAAVAEFVSEMAMPKIIADQILTSAVKHFGLMHDSPALTSAEAFRPLNAAEARDFYTEASRLCGGSEKLDALGREVRELLQARGILSEMDRRGLTKTSLALDPRFLGTLRLWLKTAPARA